MSRGLADGDPAHIYRPLPHHDDFRGTDEGGALQRKRYPGALRVAGGQGEGAHRHPRKGRVIDDLDTASSIRFQVQRIHAGRNREALSRQLQAPDLEGDAAIVEDRDRAAALPAGLETAEIQADLRQRGDHRDGRHPHSAYCRLHPVRDLRGCCDEAIDQAAVRGRGELELHLPGCAWLQGEPVREKDCERPGAAGEVDTVDLQRYRTAVFQKQSAPGRCAYGDGVEVDFHRIEKQSGAPRSRGDRYREPIGAEQLFHHDGDLGSEGTRFPRREGDPDLPLAPLLQGQGVYRQGERLLCGKAYLDGLIGVVDQGDLRLDANSDRDGPEVDAPGSDRDLFGANARGEGEQCRGEPGAAEKPIRAAARPGGREPFRFLSGTASPLPETLERAFRTGPRAPPDPVRFASVASLVGAEKSRWGSDPIS